MGCWVLFLSGQFSKPPVLLPWTVGSPAPWTRSRLWEAYTQPILLALDASCAKEEPGGGARSGIAVSVGPK